MSYIVLRNIGLFLLGAVCVALVCIFLGRRWYLWQKERQLRKLTADISTYIESHKETARTTEVFLPTALAEEVPIAELVDTILYLESQNGVRLASMENGMYKIVPHQPTL